MGKGSRGDRDAPPPLPEPIPGPDARGSIVDAHTHLDACLARTPEGRDPTTLAAVLDRATTAGVRAVVTPPTTSTRPAGRPGRPAPTPACTPPSGCTPPAAVT
jgi:hypothetical protein